MRSFFRRKFHHCRSCRPYPVRVSPVLSGFCLSVRVDTPLGGYTVQTTFFLFFGFLSHCRVHLDTPATVKYECCEVNRNSSHCLLIYVTGADVMRSRDLRTDSMGSGYEPFSLCDYILWYDKSESKQTIYCLVHCTVFKGLPVEVIVNSDVFLLWWWSWGVARQA